MVDNRNDQVLLGSNCFQLCQKDDDLRQAYRGRFAELLNFATLPFYWGSYEREPGKLNQPLLMEMAQWCRQNNLRVKGHTLVWHEVSPAWLTDKSVSEIADLQWHRIQREMTAFRGVVDMWDVVNEAVVMPERDPSQPAARLCIEMGRVELIKRSFECARAANPQATLLINDFVLDDKYAQLIDQCLQAGVKIDAIGLQSHMHYGNWTPEYTQEVLKRFEVFGLPLHFTELTIVSGPLKDPRDSDWKTIKTDWMTTDEGEATQLKDGSRIFTDLLAHPLVEAITWWDFSDAGAWQGAPAGLLRKDMSPKPLYHWLMDNVRSK